MGFVQRYQNAEGAASSDPLMDRIDIHLDVMRVPFEKLSSLDGGESSSVIRARVEAARAGQRRHGAGFRRFRTAANRKIVQRFCQVDNSEPPFRSQEPHARCGAPDGPEHAVVSPVLKLVRTIAELAGEVPMRTRHLTEALPYRPRELV